MKRDWHLISVILTATLLFASSVFASDSRSLDLGFEPTDEGFFYELSKSTVIVAALIAGDEIEKETSHADDVISAQAVRRDGWEDRKVTDHRFESILAAIPVDGDRRIFSDSNSHPEHRLFEVGWQDLKVSTC